MIEPHMINFAELVSPVVKWINHVGFICNGFNYLKSMNFVKVIKHWIVKQIKTHTPWLNPEL